MLIPGCGWLRLTLLPLLRTLLPPRAGWLVPGRTWVPLLLEEELPLTVPLLLEEELLRFTLLLLLRLALLPVPEEELRLTVELEPLVDLRCWLTLPLRVAWPEDDPDGRAWLLELRLWEE